MIDYSKNFISKQKVAKGEGLLNSLINKLPVELHLPGYQYCGPGTKLQERLARGDSGINSLDQACKEHDISYSKHKDTADRHIADRILTEKAWQRVKSKDASLSERANALLVTNLMKAKVKFGMGCSNSTVTSNKKESKMYKRKSTPNKIKHLTLNKLRKLIGDKLKRKKSLHLEKASKLALKCAIKTVKKNKGNIKTPRIIPVPKVGNAVPFLVPLFAGLSALGALTGGAAGVIKAVNDVDNAKKDLDEKKRHNNKMESIALGNGLHLKPYRKGFGLYLNPQTKNF